MRNRFALMAAMIALPVATATAQNATPRNVISIQPLSAMMTVFAGEYEHALGKAASWGLGATYWDVGDAGDEVTYTSGDFKMRYYPQGTSLHGFSIGGSLGFSNVSETVGTTEASQGGVSLGVLLEYQWLMGTKKNFSMTLGAGAKALMVNEDDFSGNEFTARYPTARVSVGYAW
jgi:hypothetical protein